MSSSRSCSVPIVLAFLAASLHAQSPAQNAAAGAAPLSANAFYREFQNNPVDATARYAGRAVVLEGLRGEMILLPGGVQAAVHVAEGSRTNALILLFSDRNQLRGISQGQRFRFRCVVDKYQHPTVWMEDCSVETAAPAGGNPTSSGPIADAGAYLLSANALYRAFQDNAIDATKRYVGRVVSLEGLRGDLIMTDGAKAAVHIADRGKPNALILQFSDRGQVSGIEKGQRFRFRCKVDQYEYLIVWMAECAIER